MAVNSMYESLLTLPLFKGLSYTRLSEIVGTPRLVFLKYLPGETILTAGDPCTHIKFVIKGDVRLTIANSNDRFRVAQTIKSPAVISPDYLFGRHTVYPGTAKAIDTVSIMQIEKADLIRLLQTDEVFTFNYLNMLSTNAQKAVDGVIALTSGSLEERIAFWIIALTQLGSEEIVLSARQRDLYTMFNVQRSSFMATLDSLKERGIIDYGINEIRVISRRALRSVLLKTPD